MKKDKKNLKTKFEQAIESASVNTKYQYWYDDVTDIQIGYSCVKWFGKYLRIDERKEVRKMLKIYPAPDKEEAIETVLFIYFANQK